MLQVHSCLPRQCLPGVSSNIQNFGGHFVFDDVVRLYDLCGVAPAGFNGLGQEPWAAIMAFRQRLSQWNDQGIIIS